MQLISSGKVKLKGYGNDRIFWEVGSGNNIVKIEERKERMGIFYNCTCKSCSIFGPEAGICTFKAAVITYSSLGVKLGTKKTNKNE